MNPRPENTERGAPPRDRPDRWNPATAERGWLGHLAYTARGERVPAALRPYVAPLVKRGHLERNLLDPGRVRRTEAGRRRGLGLPVDA